MSEIKKTRLDFVYDQLCKQYEKSAKKDKLISNINYQDQLENYIGTVNESNIFTEESMDNYIDISFLKFLSHVNLDIRTLGATFKDAIFNYFLKFDPTSNKEYLQWFINLYGNVCKDRPQIHMTNRTNENFSTKTVSSEVLFFEDFGKISESLEIFTFLKKTNVLSHQQRDINQYSTYKSFINTIKPYAPADENDDSEKVHTLTHTEIKCIQNYIDAEDKSNDAFQATETPIAELVYEDDDWVIVQTHNKEANEIFGRNTTWCTAGTRFMDIFALYHSQGPLLVLIRKGYGSVSQIRKNSNVRLQFHFESSQYMDAKDVGIKIDVFLKKYTKVKAFLTKYVDAAAFKLSCSGKPQQVVDFLKKLGYGDELIKVLKRVMPEALELDDFDLTDSALAEIGDITTLKSLKLNNCNVTRIPESFGKLTKLTNLQLYGNKKLTTIPEHINKLINLVDLDISNCDIKNAFDISGLVNLEHLIFDNNQNLTKFPTLGNIKQIDRITASNCNLGEIPDAIMNLKFLYMLDLHYNKNLKKIPIGLTTLPALVALNIHQTKIKNDDIDVLLEQAMGKTEKCAVAVF